MGTGRWGSVILKTLHTIPSCKVAYQVTRDWRTLLTKNDIDGVIIATPPATHAQIALPFIRRGIPVFIEKPMTLNVREARKLVAAAKKSRSLVFVGHIHLYNPAYQETKKLSRTLGKIRFLLGEGGSIGPFREDYSAMWDWSHAVYLMVDIMGKMPQKVSAWAGASLRPKTKLWSSSQIKLDFKGGTTGYILSSSLLPQKRSRLTIVGEKSSLVYDDILPKQKVTSYQKNKVSFPPYKAAMPLTRELEAFLKGIKKKEKPVSGIAQGLAVVQILDAAERSIAHGGASIALS